MQSGNGINAEKGLGKSKDEIKNSIKGTTAEALLSSLSAENSARVLDILSNPEKLKNILATPKAQALIEQLQGKKD